MEMIFDYVIRAVLAVITAIISCVLLPKLSQWITSKVENEKLKAVIEDVTATAQTTVDQLEQTMVAKYKEQGKWDLSSQTLVLQTAVRETANNILNSTRATLEQNGTDIDELVRRYIESYIQQKKKGA